MTKIYGDWIGTTGVDGFRLDTVKHVNMDFWPQFSQGIERGRRERPARRTSSCSARSTAPTRRSSSSVRPAGRPAGHPRLRLPGGRHAATPPPAAPRQALADVYARDDLYTARDTDAGRLPTFLGNHDMGRIGSFIAAAAADADQPPAARPARPRADVPHPRPAGRLLRRRAGLHRPRRGQGRPAGHVRHPGRRLPRRRPDRHRPAPTPATSTTQSHPLYRTIAELGRAAPGPPGAARRRPGHPVRRRRPGRLRLLPDRCRPTAPSTSWRSTTPPPRRLSPWTPGRPAPPSPASTAARPASTAGADGKLTRDRAGAVGRGAPGRPGHRRRPAPPRHHHHRAGATPRSPPGPPSPPR